MQPKKQNQINKREREEKQRMKNLLKREIKSFRDLFVIFFETLINLTISIGKDIFGFFCFLFRTDPVETLHSFLPAAHSEINPRTIAHFFFCLGAVFHARWFLSVLKGKIWFSFPDEVEEFRGEMFCPALGSLNRCERNYYRAIEGLGFLIVLTVVRYLTSIQGAKLSRRTFFRINVFQTVLCLAECIRWRIITLDIWWSVRETGAWEATKSDYEPVVDIVIYGLVTFLCVSVASFLSFSDTVKKFQEQKTWDSDDDD